LLCNGWALFKITNISVFIDGNNFYHGLKSTYQNSKKMINFNFKKFITFLSKNRQIVNIFYYNAQLDKEKNPIKYESQQRFFKKLKKIDKFSIVLCKLLKRRIKGTNRFYYVLKEDDIYMAVDMVKGAFKNYYDTAILVSGDGDFVPAVKVSQEEGKIVENIYFKKSSSRNLKNHCDKSLELTKEILDDFFE